MASAVVTEPLSALDSTVSMASRAPGIFRSASIQRITSRREAVVAFMSGCPPVGCRPRGLVAAPQGVGRVSGLAQGLATRAIPESGRALEQGAEELPVHRAGNGHSASRLWWRALSR